MGRGRAATDLVWRQAVQCEAANELDMHAATLLWDGAKYNESFSWVPIVEKLRPWTPPLKYCGTP